LRIVAGLLPATSGLVRINGQDVTRVPAHRRQVGMMFQSYALFPHMTVAENVGFGLKMLGLSATKTRAMVADVLDTVRMGSMAARYPAELSGGQQQRISLARAIVTRPRILLLDEPFGALDRKLREDMQIELKQLQRELGLTFVCVTHDQEEALTLSDTIVVMRAGRIEQIGRPPDIFDRPTTRFVAEFFGTLNTVEVDVVQQDGTTTQVEAPCGKWFVGGGPAQGLRPLFAVRASDTHISKERPLDPSAAGLPGLLEDVIYKGTLVLCRVRLAGGVPFTATGTPDAIGTVNPGDTVVVSWSPHKAFLFPNGGGGAPGASRESETGAAKRGAG
jgi:ABC-type Fe3+/spermidine/putrescine transport system ATPase subunit